MSGEAIERLLAEAEQLPDPRARALAKALAAALVDLVGTGLARTIELGGQPLARAMADDELVGNLLVLCGMHPDPAVVRAERALAAAGAQLGSIGVIVDGVDPIGDGVRVRLSPDRGGAANADRVRAMIESIVVARAPDLDTVAVELAGAPVTAPGFVPIERLRVIT